MLMKKMKHMTVETRAIILGYDRITAAAVGRRC